MYYSTYRFTLDIHKARSQVSIPVLFQDTWVKLLINLTDGGKPYVFEDGCTARLVGKKADGTALVQDCPIIDNNTRIEYTFTEQTASALGPVECEIRLFSSSGLQLTSPSFTIVVGERVIRDEDIIESETDKSAIDRILASEAVIEAAATKAEEEADRAEEAASRATAGGADGSSVSVSSVSESTASGGSNVVTFSDGKQLTVKNGKDGDDYVLTAADKQEIADDVKGVCVAKNQGAANVGKILVVGTDGNLTLADMPEGGPSGDVIGTLDDSNNILLSGNLADGTYTLKYENEDGTYTDVGTLTVGAVEPEVPNLFNAETATYNARLGSDCTVRTDANGAVVTDYIDVVNYSKVKIGGTFVLNSRFTLYGKVCLYDSNNAAQGAGLGFDFDPNGYEIDINSFRNNYPNIVKIRVCLSVAASTVISAVDVENITLTPIE